MKLRYKIGLVVAVLGSVYLFGRCQRPLRSGGIETNGPNRNGPAVLSQNDIEQILFDPIHKSVIINKPGSTQTLTLPDRPTVIDIHKDGTTSVTSPQSGFEHRFFIGVHVSDHIRVAGGMDGYYLKKLDLGGGIAGQLGNHIPIIFGQLAYNFYSNCRVAVSYGTNRYIGGTLTVRL